MSKRDEARLSPPNQRDLDMRFEPPSQNGEGLASPGTQGEGESGGFVADGEAFMTPNSHAQEDRVPLLQHPWYHVRPR